MRVLLLITLLFAVVTLALCDEHDIEKRGIYSGGYGGYRGGSVTVYRSGYGSGYRGGYRSYGSYGRRNYG